MHGRVREHSVLLVGRVVHDTKVWIYLANAEHPITFAKWELNQLSTNP